MSVMNRLVATTCVVVGALAIAFTDTGHALAAMAQHVIVDSGNVNVQAVSGTVSVTPASGSTFAATQSGLWTVGLAGSPTVMSGDTTALIQAQLCSEQSGELASPPIDVSPYKSVRVFASFVNPGAPTPPPLRIIARVPNFNGGLQDYILDESATGMIQGVYDTPGATLLVRATGPISPIATMEVAIYGRHN